MIAPIVAALQQALSAIGNENQDGRGYAYHCGEAAGIAAAAGVFGIKALEMCDDISGAYEDVDVDFMRYILSEALERPDNGNEHYARTRDPEIYALEFEAALQEAMRAKLEGDLERYSLMIGFTVGLMFQQQGPSSGPGEVRARIIAAYETSSDEILQQAQGPLAFGARMSDPMGFMGKERAARYYEERVRTMRWVQNFGLRQARSTDGAVAIPNSLSINYQLTQRDGEENLMPVEDAEVGSLEGAPEAAAYVNSGTAKHKDGDYDGAIADFDRAIAIEPDNVEAIVNRAVCKQNKDDRLGAIADWNRALQLKPDDGGWYVNRGMVKENIGDYDGALADYNRAAEAEPDYEVAYIARAGVKTKQGDYEGAIAEYDRVIALWPDNAAAFDDRGLARSHLGDYDAAIVDFSRAIELQPSNAGYHLNRGTAKANAKDYPGAIADFARAVELDPRQAGNAGNADEAGATVVNTIADSLEASQMTNQEQSENPPHPIHHCYWVVPGKLLAGEYPRNVDEASSKEKLRYLTDAGVSAFIDLTEPNELTQHGPLKSYAHLLELPAHHHRFAIRDQGVPASEELTRRVLDAIDAHIAAGERVYVHCWGGVGRTGTIIGCWLARHHEPGHAALGRLAKLWQENPKSCTRCSPETPEQVRYVLEWGESDS